MNSDSFMILKHVFCGKYNNFCWSNTIKPIYNGHSIMDKTKILMTNGSLMNVKDIAVQSF